MPTKKQWVYAPAKPPKSKVPDYVKAEVQKKADQFVETFLKPNFIKPPPEDTQWNYIVDIYAKWHRSYFYFCSKYHCPGPTAMADYFEDKFARLEYVGNGKFNSLHAAYRAVVGNLSGSSLDQCLEAIHNIPNLQP